ncbi:MAG: hypothetical protein WC959_08440 [Kiritimatiellales bacterium]
MKNENEKRLILNMVHHNPGEAPYESIYNDPEFLKRRGYNGEVFFLFESPLLAISWETVDPNFFPTGSAEKKWMDAKRAAILKKHDACRRAGIDVYAQGDLVLLPTKLIEREQIRDVFGDPRHPRVQELLKIQIAETFDQFPALDGLVVRIGETYLHDAPFHSGAIHDKWSAAETIIPLAQLLREEVCARRNKKLIFRTWLSFDRNLETYLNISAAVEPHPDFIFAVKHCENDFHRATAFSEIIGKGRHPQLIEVQCAREYEGKGAYPNYVMNGVIEGFEEHVKTAPENFNSLREFAGETPEMFAGIWTWCRGGGWDGPYISNELWTDLNAYVVSQWGQNPAQSEAEIFNRYAAGELKLNATDIQKFRRLCLLSAAAVVRGRNSTFGDMEVWWTRDQGIAWPGVEMWAEANKSPEAIRRNLKQKDESVEIWKEIVALAEEIQWADAATKEFAIASSLYGLHLYEIYRALIYMADASTRGDANDIRRRICAYDDAWAAYQKLPETYPSCATLYTKEYDCHIFNDNNADKKVEQLRMRYTP